MMIRSIITKVKHLLEKSFDEFDNALNFFKKKKEGKAMLERAKKLRRV